jgi:hypothetical protein
VFVVPECRVPEVIASGDPAAAMERGRVTVAVCAVAAESLTITVTLKLPLEVDVPEMIPVVAPRLRPAGRLPPAIDQVKGAVPPLVCRVLE